MKQDTLRVLLLGKAGSGKSSLGDNLLGEKRFSKFRNLKDWIDRPESRSVQAQNSRFGRHINIVDTPGIFNTGHTDLQVANAIRKCILLTKPGPHAIILNRYIMLDTKGTDVENATKALIFGIEQMVKDNQNGFYPCEHVIGSNTSQLRAERIGADENRCQKKRKNGRQLTRSFLQKILRERVLALNQKQTLR
ncbi:unnamed protein product [Mytilus edulis]|uniref:AIG1-type G domain-containing protein n=1 Tax=Mytilus edulis TaxID=6550 RepID=A0A8S3UDZ5_MYTED|nr:unnamed protein product [Mytilus edulis]